MPNGRAPTWDTVRSRYWKNRAGAVVRENTGEFDAANLAKMQGGNAPLDANGKPMELHHNSPQRDGGPHVNNPINLREFTGEQHAVMDPCRHLGN
ncbi:MAG: hypothetical protein F8N15_09030 [Methanobacterium sp.]|nr:hypothetical protein [Methanobacterium sp.]